MTLEHPTYCSSILEVNPIILFIYISHHSYLWRQSPLLHHMTLNSLSDPTEHPNGIREDSGSTKLFDWNTQNIWWYCVSDRDNTKQQTPCDTIIVRTDHPQWKCCPQMIVGTLTNVLTRIPTTYRLRTPKTGKGTTTWSMLHLPEWQHLPMSLPKTG